MTFALRPLCAILAGLLIAAPNLSIAAQTATTTGSKVPTTSPLMIASPATPSVPACGEDPAFRAQDFTLGTWTVLMGTKTIAHVTIARVLKGCALSEDWQVGHDGAGSGQGLFTFSRLYRKWYYLWADNRGSATSFTGSSPEQGKLVYTTVRPLTNGKTRRREWTLTLMPDGSVDELARGTEDNGTTWTTEYDLHWVK